MWNIQDSLNGKGFIKSRIVIVSMHHKCNSTSVSDRLTPGHLVMVAVMTDFGRSVLRSRRPQVLGRHSVRRKMEPHTRHDVELNDHSWRDDAVLVPNHRGADREGSCHAGEETVQSC